VKLVQLSNKSTIMKLYNCANVKHVKDIMQRLNIHLSLNFTFENQILNCVCPSHQKTPIIIGGGGGGGVG
jgi:hypothetical protein